MIPRVTIANPQMGVSTQFFNKGLNARVESVLPKAVEVMKSRANKQGQFMNWIDLPKAQIKRVDNIYAMVEQLRSQTDAKVLTVLGIGGSKHTVEHMLSINGLNLKGDDVKFYSDIDSTSFNRYLQQIDGNITKSNFLVASKSGSTFETKDGMLRVMNKLNEVYNPTKVFPLNGERMTARHMVAVTDQNAEKSELRRLSNSQGWLGDLYIHDDVGGRFSALDDHALFTLAWAGMKKEDMVKMLESAQKMSDSALSMNGNMPLAQAALWASQRIDGVKDSVHQYLGDEFVPTATWETQMINESLKDSARQVTKITDACHHSSEAWYNPANKYAFMLTAPVDKGAAKENVEGYIGAIAKSNADSGESMVELVETSNLGLTPEAAGAMTQSRAFSTIYQGIIEREALRKEQPEVLPEVLQPNVEFYKKNLKPIGDNQPPVVAGRISVNA